jgi:hypothetical protein
MLSVLSSTNACLGVLLGSCRGYRAFNANGQPIAGYFGTKDQAVEAIASAISTA